MTLCALRLLHRLSTPESATLATSLSFATTLQLAAGRAWSRRVAARTQQRNTGTRGISSTGTRRPAPRRTDRDISAHAGPSTIMNAKSLHHNDCTPPKKPNKRLNTDVNAVETEAHGIAKPLIKVAFVDPIANQGIPHNAEQRTHASSRVHPHDEPPTSRSYSLWEAKQLRAQSPPLPPPPQSRTDLYRNLLHLVMTVKPAPRLPALIDYHSLYPQFQSTRSYNLLIYLGIRHTNYGIVHRLLRDHAEMGFPRNMETYQLEVRSLIQQGRWNQAWKYVLELKDEGQLPETSPDSTGIPLSIWLEFCRPVRLLRTRRRNTRDAHGRLLDTFFVRNTETATDLKRHQHLLSQHRPDDMPHLSQTSPYAIYCIVQLLMRSGDHGRALDLTKSFVRALPRSLKHNEIRRCLDIIHIHMHGSPAKDGLPRFYQLRRTMVSLLKLHRGLRPNPKTLYLLLAPLQRAKKCGTIAWKVLNSAKKEWGPLVEDRVLQRRVVDLALKEGRMDIVRKLVQMESAQRPWRQLRLNKVQEPLKKRPIMPATHSHVPLRLVYPKKGIEARRWWRLRVRVQMKGYKGVPRPKLLSRIAENQGLDPSLTVIAASTQAPPSPPLTFLAEDVH